MVNNRPRTALLGAFAAGFLGLTLAAAGANGTFPLGQTLTGAEGPLPGCRQAPSMTVSADRIHFRVCCNQISAPGRIEGDRLVITGPAIATRMHCGEGQASEDRFLKQLDSQRQIRWRQEGDRLVLETEPPLSFRMP